MLHRRGNLIAMKRILRILNGYIVTGGTGPPACTVLGFTALVSKHMDSLQQSCSKLVYQCHLPTGSDGD